MELVKNRQGFTLIELSIVLVIISLIVGGVIGGKSLIHSSEVNQAAQGFLKLETAINAFKLQYDAIPGDMRDATSYWPSCVDVGSKVCNGNGDQKFDALERPEKHMQLAEVIVMPTYEYTTGVSEGRIVFYTKFMGYKFSEVSGIYVGGKSGNFLGISLVTGEGHGGVLSGRDGKSIDRKIDDGVADSGKLTAGYVDDSATGCASGEAVENDPSSYNLDTEANFDCEMFYWMK